MKQKIVTLEQENREINARVTDSDAKIAAEKLRADKAEELTKNTVQAPVEEENSIAVSASTYDDALKSFRLHKYDAAVKGFKAIVEGSSGAELTSRAQLLAGRNLLCAKKI